MNFVKGHTYKWNISGTEQIGIWTGELDTMDGFENNLIMKNSEGVLWSINPQYITTEVK